MDSDAKTVHFSVPRINHCFTMTDTLLPPSFDWTKGCVFVQSGQIFYSPNCNRPVVIPPCPDFDSSNSVFEQQKLDARNFKQPVWWDSSYGWMSFIPLCPSFTAAPFEPFCWLPPIAEFAIPAPEHDLEAEIQYNFQMDPQHAEIWKDHETKLVELARVVRLWYNVPGNLPPTPSSFGYARVYCTRAKTLKMIYLAREWFAIWVGYISYLLASVQAYPTTSKKRHPTIPEWYFRLLDLCDMNHPTYPEDYLDGLMSSTACTFNSNTPRAGVVFQWSHYRQYRPSINFFHDHHIPMYFPWTLTEEQEIERCPELKCLRPPSDMIATALNVLFKEPSLPLASLLLQSYVGAEQESSDSLFRCVLNLEHPATFVERLLFQKLSSEPSRTQGLTSLDSLTREQIWKLLQEHEATHLEAARIAASLPTQGMIRHVASAEEAQLFHDWRDFFERRERRHREIMMVEDQDAKELRMSRSYHPEIESAAVYLWQKIRSSGGVYLFVRVRVPNHKNVDLVNNYIRSQRVYNSVSNEWDLCYHFTPPIHLSHEITNEDQDDELYWGTYEDEDILPFPQDLGEISDTFNEELCCSEGDVSSSVDICHSSLSDQDRFQSSNMLKTLFYSYGYVHPLCNNDLYSNLGSISWSLASQALGFTKGGADRDLIQRDRDTIGFFLDKLVKNTLLPPADLFDLHDNHYRPPILSRMIDMKFIHRPAPNFFVISGPQSKSSEWSLGFQSAAGVVYALRLLSSKASHTVATVAHQLLHYGVPFWTLHTFYGKEDVHNVAIPYTPTSFRQSNYTFTVADYEASMLKCQQVLSKPQGRAALLKGGIIGRIAREFLSLDEALEGPSVEVTKHYSGIFFPHAPEARCCGDDELTEQELADICCTYSMYTDLESQVCVRSWWPPHSVWLGNRNGCRWLEWTERNEQFFIRHRRDILSGKAQPLRANQWKEKLRGHVFTRKLFDNCEALAQSYMDKNFPVQGPF